MIIRYLFLMILGISPCLAPFSFAKESQTPTNLKLLNNPVEVGSVEWERDYYTALAKSKVTGKPLFMLFQEVPGCIGCQNFGQKVLTYPLLVEAIEDEFIPLFIFNNRSEGHDNKILKKFNEPSWNYQVIRFIDSSGKDLIPRKDKIWSIGGVATRMIKALRAAQQPVPPYLEAVAMENDRKNLGVVAFSMACFWTGEYKLGKIDNVVTTEAGWYDHREVTLLRYNKKNTTLQSIVDHAAAEKCAQTVYTREHEQLDKSRFPIKRFILGKYRKAPPEDQKKQLQKWLNRQPGLHLSQMQLMKLNSFMVDNPAQALKWLSPRQLLMIK